MLPLITLLLEQPQLAATLSAEPESGLVPLAVAVASLQPAEPELA